MYNVKLNKHLFKIVRFGRSRSRGRRDPIPIHRTDPSIHHQQARRPSRRLNSPRTTTKMAAEVTVAGAGAGENKAATTTDGSGVETTGGRRTKLVRVQQRYIDCLLKRTPVGPFRTLSDETIDAVYETPEKREWYLRFQAETAALLKAKDKEDAILEQYREHGFAMEEVLVGDDDDEQ